MKSRLTLATLAAAAALVALPTASQAGGLGLGRADCLFSWMRHDRAAAPAKVATAKPKKAKKVAAKPMK
jgi:hypothetical protein